MNILWIKSLQKLCLTGLYKCRDNDKCLYDNCNGKMNNSSSENAEVTFRIFLVCRLEERSLKDFSGLTSLKA